jgi:hypothetical protein
LRSQLWITRWKSRASTFQHSLRLGAQALGDRAVIDERKLV